MSLPIADIPLQDPRKNQPKLPNSTQEQGDIANSSLPIQIQLGDDNVFSSLPREQLSVMPQNFMHL